MKFKLCKLQYYLLGLGDSTFMTYLHFPNNLKKAFDSLGAKRMYKQGEADVCAGQESLIKSWIKGLWHPLGVGHISGASEFEKFQQKIHILYASRGGDAGNEDSDGWGFTATAAENMECKIGTSTMDHDVELYEMNEWEDNDFGNPENKAFYIILTSTHNGTIPGNGSRFYEHLET
jgi:sulfite reductase alpha subunit-like flavoprotein